MKTAWNLEWDFFGYKNHWPNIESSPDIENAWCQTLITRINQTSAQIFKKSNYGGANKIKIHSALLPLFKSIEFFKIEGNEMILSGRFTVLIDNNMNKDRIYVYRDEFPMTPIFLNENNVIIHKKSPEFEFYKNKKDNDPTFNLHIVSQRSLQGKITVLNYIKPLVDPITGHIDLKYDQKLNDGDYYFGQSNVTFKPKTLLQKIKNFLQIK